MNRTIRTAGLRLAMASRRRSGAALLGIAVLAGCASISQVHLHTLMAPEPPARSAAAATLGPDDGPPIVLETVRVPAQVDQAQWLVGMPDGTLALLENERWASPLPDELRDALREILMRRFGAIESAAGTSAARLWRVRVEVSRFESAPGQARLEVTWTLFPRNSAGTPLRCLASLQESAAVGMTGIAAAHRRAVGRLGDAIGEQLLALQRGGPGRCPA
jgi:uncharacterized lipoprotein YmbA